MPKVGDRVIVAGTKIGNPARQGTLIGTVGPLINVRWEDGTVSLFKPGAGSVSFESGSNGGGRKAAAKPATTRAKAAPKAGKSAPAAKKKVAAKKPAAKVAARKPAAKKAGAKKAAAKKKPAAKKKR